MTGQTPGGMRTITLNPGDVPPDNGVDYIVESNHYTNYTDQWGNVCVQLLFLVFMHLTAQLGLLELLTPSASI